MKGIDMLQIRKNVFETNSSSTHSITMCSQDEYDAWMKGDVLLNDGWWGKDNTSEFKNKKFVTRAEAEDIIRKDPFYNEEKDGDLSKVPDNDLAKGHYDYETKSYVGFDYGFYTFDNYMVNEYLEWFEEEYTTPSGDTVVAFGLYGTDY